MKKLISILLSVIMIISITTLPSGIVSSASDIEGIVLSSHNITIEKGEACVIFASRYGFTAEQKTTNLTWSKTADAGTDSSWIHLGTHGTNRQKALITTIINANK